MHKNRADALVPALLVLGALLIAADVVWTFTLAPLVQGAQLSEPVVIAGQMVTTKLLLSQKIFTCMSLWPSHRLWRWASRRSMPCASS